MKGISKTTWRHIQFVGFETRKTCLYPLQHRFKVAPLLQEALLLSMSLLADLCRLLLQSRQTLLKKGLSSTPSLPISPFQLSPMESCWNCAVEKGKASAGSCYLASDSAPLVVCDLPKKLLRVSLLLLVLPALRLQLLELQVLETLGFCLEHFTVLGHTQKCEARQRIEEQTICM